MEFFKFKLHKSLDPHIDKKKLKDIGDIFCMAFLRNPNISEYKETKYELSEKSIEMITRLNDEKDILNKVILLTHDKYIRNFNILSSRNKIDSIIYAIRNLN